MDAATNLAAFVLDGEVVATASLKYTIARSWHMIVESSIPVEVSGDRVTAIHVETE